MDAADIIAGNERGCAMRLAAHPPAPALIAPEPHWLSHRKCTLATVLGEIKRGRPYEKFTFTEAEGSQPAKLEIQLGTPYEEVDTTPVSLKLATYACAAFDFRAKVAGAWGPECKVTKVLSPKGKLTEVLPLIPADGQRYDFTWAKPGKHSVRYIVENGAGRQIDCTVFFTIKIVNDLG